MMEEILERELSRVRAPRELWDRVENPVDQRAAGPRLTWALAAAALVAIVIVSAVRLWGGTGIAPLQTAEFQSTDAAQIRGWVKAQAGLDVPLAAGLPASVQLEGARLMGANMAEVAYLVDGRPVTLAVSKSGGAWLGGSHAFANREGKTVSWSMQGQRFTLACANPRDVEAACLICHGDGIPHGT